MSICDFQLLPLAGPGAVPSGGTPRPAAGVKPSAPAAGDLIARAAAKASAFMRSRGAC
ncbi:MAG TPA: hypothetical protein VF680_00970 [Allosphingosinicella sp.]